MMSRRTSLTSEWFHLVELSDRPAGRAQTRRFAPGGLSICTILTQMCGRDSGGFAMRLMASSRLLAPVLIVLALLVPLGFAAAEESSGLGELFNELLHGGPDEVTP